MVSDFDREKVVDCMFDPVTSAILAELEDGGKLCSYLSEHVSIPENEVAERLSYLIEHDFIQQSLDDGKTVFTANSEKLTQIVENSENFGATIEGLEKMDSFLN